MKVTDGISFSIPSKYAISLLETSNKANQKKYKYMGIKIITLTLPLYRMLKIQSNFDIKIPKNFVQGCLVIEVEPNSPSER
jgi:S1-C subfamily serine protease